MKTAIIIPARMASQRFPNKPMAKINGIPMIERVWRQGINSKTGDVYVACSEDEVFNLIISKGGKAIMTDPNLPSGTDRVFAAFNLLKNKDDYELIKEDDRFSVDGLKNFSKGSAITLIANHSDGTKSKIQCLHSYNNAQVEWFKKGSALNVLKQTQA